MTKRSHRHSMTRRRFIQACACTVAAGATGGVGYVAMNAPLPAPQPEAAAFLTPVAGPLESGAPILLVTNSRTTPSFGAYLGAVLRAEGIVAFRSAYLADIQPAVLAQFPLVLLAAGELTATESELFEKYVIEGGNLIALRPDRQLAAVMGVRFTGGTTDNMFLAVGDHSLSAGIVKTALQIHTPVDEYDLSGAETVAWLTYRDGAITSRPAVTINRAGKGVAALWAFDLPQCIALIRQGDPMSANQERDGLDGIRTMDLFVDWIDEEAVEVPQADELQRLLANMIHALAGEAPLPRLWYLPRDATGVLVATGDAHGIQTHHITPGIEIAERYGGAISVYYTTPNVSAARRTVRRIQWWAQELPVVGWVFEEDSGYPTPQLVAGWRERGHEFGLHPWVEAGVSSGYNHAWNDFVKHGYGPSAPTVRTHRLLWSGWVDTARVQAQYAIRMNLDHYHAGPGMRRSDGGWMNGYLTGTGLPMPFVDQQGNLLSVYQQHTHIVDEHQISVFDHGYEMNLSAADGVALSRRQIDVAVDRFPSALGLQAHFDPFAFGEEKAALERDWLDGILQHAVARGVAILSAEQWLKFTEMRSQAEMRDVSWDAEQRRLSFELIADGDQERRLELLAPAEHQQRALREISVDGSPVDVSRKLVGGVQYGAVAITAGRRRLQFQY